MQPPPSAPSTPSTHLMQRTSLAADPKPWIRRPPVPATMPSALMGSSAPNVGLGSGSARPAPAGRPPTRAGGRRSDRRCWPVPCWSGAEMCRLPGCPSQHPGSRCDPARLLGRRPVQELAVAVRVRGFWRRRARRRPSPAGGPMSAPPATTGGETRRAPRSLLQCRRRGRPTAWCPLGERCWPDRPGRSRLATGVGRPVTADSVRSPNAARSRRLRRRWWNRIRPRAAAARRPNPMLAPATLVATGAR